MKVNCLNLFAWQRICRLILTITSCALHWVGQEPCQFFLHVLTSCYKKLRKVFKNAPFRFCLLDEFMPDPKSLCDIPVIKLSALKNFEAKDNLLVLIRQDALSLKFWDYFSKIGIKNILIYGKKKNYARVSRSLLLNLRGIYDVYNSLDSLSQEYYAGVYAAKYPETCARSDLPTKSNIFLRGIAQ